MLLENIATKKPELVMSFAARASKLRFFLIDETERQGSYKG